MPSNSTHEQVVELKRHAPAAITHHRVRITVDLADIARRYGPRASASISGRCRFLEGAVIVEHLGQSDTPAL